MRTWFAVIPFAKAFFTLSLVIIPIIRFEKRVLKVTKLFRTEVWRGLSILGCQSPAEQETHYNEEHTCISIYMVVGLQDDETLLRLAMGAGAITGLPGTRGQRRSGGSESGS